MTDENQTEARLREIALEAQRKWSEQLLGDLDTNHPPKQSLCDIIYASLLRTSKELLEENRRLESAFERADKAYRDAKDAISDRDSELLRKCKGINRAWAMPNPATFDVPPIANFVKKYLSKSQVSVDPFAGDKRWATYTNDINHKTKAETHMDAQAFLESLSKQGIKADLVIFDPPYSPRQISECYHGIFQEVTLGDTQNGALYSRVRARIPEILIPGGVVLSFGWNSTGMGKKYGFAITEILLVAHGGAHNDTICIAERRTNEVSLGDIYETIRETSPWETCSEALGDRVLEPSAGTGAIAAEIVRNSRGTLLCVEHSASLVEGLRRHGYVVESADFLEVNGQLGEFDRVVMNPPFENAADIKHILHAFKMLRPGGRLVALCANGPRQS